MGYYPAPVPVVALGLRHRLISVTPPGLEIASLSLPAVSYRPLLRYYQADFASFPLSDLFPDESQLRFGVFITDGGARRAPRMCVEAVAAAEHVKLDAEDRQGAAE